jgi:SanA protein
MFRKLARLLFRGATYLILAGAAALVLPRAITAAYSISRIQGVEDVKASQAAIVFGAALRRDGDPSAVLRDRIDTAAELYFAGKVQALLMSGSSQGWDEPASMAAYAQRLGVPAEDILLDLGGERTYDTCYRAIEVFGLTEAILVTQAYHQPRALYLCNQLGLPSVGVAAQESRYWRGAMTWWRIREFPATLLALWEAHVTQPQPAMAGNEATLMNTTEAQ